MNKPISVYRPCAGVSPPLAAPGHRVQRYDARQPVSSLPVARKQETLQWPPRLAPGQAPEGVPDFVDSDGQEWRHGYHGPR